MMTIIVIVILAVAVILSIANNNPIENANEAKFKSDVKSIQEELELIKASNYAKNKGENYNNPETKEPISILELTSSNKYEDKFSVKDGELKYNARALSEKEVEWCKELGVVSSSLLLNTKEEYMSKGFTVDTSANPNSEEPMLKGKYTGNETDITIGEGIVYISEEAFRNNTTLERVQLPSTCYIAENQFYGCSALKEVNIPSCNGSIQDSAFENCVSLEEIVMPDSVTSISYRAFAGCESLKKVVLSQNLIEIEALVFNGCKSLEGIELPSKLQKIYPGVFNDCSKLTSIEIPDTVNFIGEEAFFGCDNLTITMSQETFDTCFSGLSKEEALAKIGGKEIVIK